jgi:predicted phage terminase large subunit-like protein
MRQSSKELLTEIFKKTILENPYIPHTPTAKQAEFLLLHCREALYGGAAGGGKSDALLMGALQFMQEPQYSAIIFRRTYNDLALPGALMDRALEWLAPTDAKWNSIKHIWTFPSGATLTFGNLEHEQDKFRYQSAEFQYIAFDELTQFLESQYRYLFSRLRRLEDRYVPLRMRSASNPGNIGHDWVKRRFLIEGEKKGRVFIPAKLDENPYLDQETYIQSLNNLDPITRRQYLKGDWSARHGGSKFFREWFQIVGASPANAKRVRYWDLAATTPKPGKEPDYTVGLKMALKDGVFYVEDVRRIQRSPQYVENLVKQTAVLDGGAVHIYMEQEPGSSGVTLTDHYARKVLVGYTFRADRVTGPKEVRADPVSSAAEAGNIKIVNGAWVNDYLDELEAFPEGSHDDQVDATSGAFSKLSKPKGFFV